MKSKADIGIHRNNPSLRRLLASTIALSTLGAISCNTLVHAQSPRSSRSTESQNAEDERVYWSRLDFVIPFNVDSTGQSPREIRLEFSADEGRTWSLYQRSDVRTQQFQFQATKDGEYQFRLKTVDAQGRSFDNPGAPLRVVVDTTKPEASLVVGVDQQGVMEAGFSLADNTLDTSTIQLTYQTDDMSQPREIPYDIELDTTDGKWNGLGRWTLPNNARQMAVRLMAQDKAGNTVEAIKFPKLLLSASATTGMQLASGKTRVAQPTDSSVSSAPTAPVGSGVAIAELQPLPQVRVLSGPGAKQSVYDLRLAEQIMEQQQLLISRQQQFIDQQQSAAKQMLTTSPSHAPSSSSTQLPVPQIEQVPKASSQGQSEMSLAQGSSRSSKLPIKEMTDEEYEQVFAPKKAILAGKRSDSILVQDTNPTTSLPSQANTYPPTATPKGSASLEIEPRSTESQPAPRLVERIEGIAPFRNNIKPLYSSSKTFSLDYAIDNDSDAQVASVELWGTTDEGRTWQMWGKDPDRASPFDIQVETEGLFGFRMIIVGANGLASNRPRNGDNADAWIMVDTQVPTAKITSALYGKGTDAGSMVIEYRASDDFFGERPITLSYSESPEGPWTTIASGIRNNGRYVWPADPSLPTSIFLRLEAHDAAGNVAVHRFENRIDVEGLAPRGRIQGFRPLPK